MIGGNLLVRWIVAGAACVGPSIFATEPAMSADAQMQANAPAATSSMPAQVPGQQMPDHQMPGGHPGGGKGAPGIISDPNYQLGAGDRVRVIVYGQPDLTGEFQVNGTGEIAFPLIGNVDAGGLSATQLESQIASKLQPDYLRDPRVSVEIMTYRPFYIVGEVNNPGNYAYTNGMTVINAVAMAGGFTYRAKEEDFYITRAGDPSNAQQDAQQQTKVRPGDVITVRERWF